jgi:transcriptional regulator with XRE-family HTH domain
VGNVLGERLREARERRGWRPEDVAVALRRSSSTIVAYEHGNRVPSARVLAQLAQVLGVSADWLLGLDTDSSPYVRAAQARLEQRRQEES